MHMVVLVTNFLSKDTSVQLQLNSRQDVIFIIIMGVLIRKLFQGKGVNVLTIRVV